MFNTSNYVLERPLPKGKKNKNVIGLMKDVLGGKNDRICRIKSKNI